MFELIHTSAKQGLIANRSGFCSVAWTEGIPSNLIAPIENLSSYQPLYAAHTPEAKLNPVCFAYRKCGYGSRTLRVVSRIGFAGVDYSGRSNRIAHHLIFEDREELDAVPGGAVAVCLESANFRSGWNEEPKLLAPRRPRSVANPLGIADAWKRLTGDPGWAGVVAEGFLDGSMRNCYLEFSAEVPAEELLELIAEVARLLPPERLDDFTFSTYFVQAPSGGECFLRCCPAGSPALDTIRRLRPQEVIRLGVLETIPENRERSPLVDAARTGIVPLEWSAGMPKLPPQVEFVPLTGGKRPVPEEEFYRVSDRTPVPIVLPEAPASPPPAEPAAEEPAPPGNTGRKLVFLTGIIAVPVLLAAGGYWLMKQMKPASGGPEAPPVVVRVTEPAAPVVPPAASESPEVSESPVVPAEKEAVLPPVPVPEPVPPPPPPEPVAEIAPPPPPVEKKPEPRLRRLTPAESFALYRDWMEGRGSIRLPAAVARAERLQVELETVGKIRAGVLNWKQFVADSADGRMVRLLPARMIRKSPEVAAVYLPEGDRPESELILRLGKAGALEIALPMRVAGTTPGLGNILRIHFLAPGEDVVWEARFQPGYAELTGKGTLQIGDKWQLGFEPSADERKFAPFLEVRVGSLPPAELSRSTLSALCGEWNWRMGKLDEVKRELEKLRSELADIGGGSVSQGWWALQESKLDDLLGQAVWDPKEIMAVAGEMSALVFQAAAAEPERAVQWRNELTSAMRDFHAQCARKGKNARPVERRDYYAEASAKLLERLDKLESHCVRLRKLHSDIRKQQSVLDREKSNLQKLVKDLRAELARISPVAEHFFDSELEAERKIVNDAGRRAAFAAKVPVTHRMAKDAEGKK